MKTDTSSYPLNRVWKIASRWSEDGNEGSSVLDVFRDHKFVFVGRVPEKFSQVEVGDLLVVSDGREVVAMGAALSKPAPITSLPIQFSDEERMRFHYEDWVLGCDIAWVDLKEEDFVHYRSGAFHAVHENADHYRDLYRNYTTESADEGGFEIQARSCTLARNVAASTDKESDDVLWREATRYVIPIFQRAYSWGQDEVGRLVNDLLDAFAGRTGDPQCAPMFIGTMQVESRVKCHEDGFKGQHQVIDGQQRLTTLLLLLRALELAGITGGSLLPADYTRRLSTKVGAGVFKEVQQTYLRETLEWDGQSEFPTSELNRYHNNLVMIREMIATVPELEVPGSRSAFVDYLLSKVYFVVIETRAGLSKTLQIFKAINTTGLDLSGGDVFKIRFYEYLRFHDKDKSSERDQETFIQVAKLYDEIEERNDKAGWHIAGMEDILSIARHYVATEADLAHAARLAAGTTFFEHFFDVVINKQTRNGFAREKCEGFKLTLGLIRDLIDVRFRWDEPGSVPYGAEAKAMETFIWRSRYSSYYEVLFLFSHRFDPSPAEIERFTIAFSKLLLVHSLLYERINEGRRTFLHELLKRFSTSRTEETVDSIITHMEEISASRGGEVLRAMNNHPLAWMSSKNLVCRLVAMLDELEVGTLTADELHKLIFMTYIDIEHIEASGHADQTWEAELNRLGNLIVLEFDLNRSLQHKDYATDKRGRYLAESNFRSVKNFAEQNTVWSAEHARNRREALADNLTSYLCGPKAAIPADFPS